MTFLALDIGNTRLKWALYAAPQPGSPMLTHGAVFLETIDELADKQWHGLAAPRYMLGSVVAGDAIKRRVEEQLELWEDVEPHWVVPAAQAGGVINGYEHPTRLGADRWVALIGARQHVLGTGAPRPALVVMVGTAVTVDTLDAHGRFLGGLILPGFGLMLRALEMGTAGLKVPTGEVRAFPTNTSDALMSGGAYAIAGAIERVYRQLQTQSHAEPALLMTGGASPKLRPIVDLPFTVVDSLIFDGLLRLAAEKAALSS
jgi:type III pantothenate kinase